MLRKERGDSKAAPAASEEVLYKIDIPANRYDMLCLEGISRALNVFRDNTAPPKYAVSSFESLQVRYQCTVTLIIILNQPVALLSLASMTCNVWHEKTRAISWCCFQAPVYLVVSCST